MTDDATTTAGSGAPSLAVRGGVAVAGSVLANVALVLAADAIGIAPDFRALTVPPVALLSALGAGGATAVYWLTGRYATDGDRTFLRVAAAVLLLSFLPDVALLVADPAATVPAVVVLALLHVVVAVVAVWSLVYWRPRP